MKAPRMYVRSGETYAAARVRWLRKFCDYRDAQVMRTCLGVSAPIKSKQFVRAFYGVEVRYIDL